jgi:hypothetical protein
MTADQRRLANKHGTPAEFAVAVYKCVPGDISMAEARAAVNEYNVEWAEAGQRVLRGATCLVKPSRSLRGQR